MQAPFGQVLLLRFRLYCLVNNYSLRLCYKIIIYHLIVFLHMILQIMAASIVVIMVVISPGAMTAIGLGLPYWLL